MAAWCCRGCQRTYQVNELIVQYTKLECPACFQRGLTGLLEPARQFPWRSNRNPESEDARLSRGSGL
jgi:DNA-directed RNA polymerase subunit RPC12/RpoP